MVKSHVNFVVADSQWERIAAYSLDKHPRVKCFVKNAGLGFAIPYLHAGTGHDYLPDFIVRLDSDKPTYLIVETKGHDDKLAEKAAAANRWVDAVNSDGRFGQWSYVVLKQRASIGQEIQVALDAM